MTSKHGARFEVRLAVVTSLFLFAGGFVGCGFTDQQSTGAGGSGGTTGSSGASGTGSPGGTNGGGGGGSAGTTGTGGSNDGGADSAAGTGGGGTTGAGGTSACPTMPVPGDCSAPANIKCPYPKLSQTGCIDAASPTGDAKNPVKMASVVVPYEVNSPLWSDAAFKTRGMRVPTGKKIHVKDCAKNPDECCVPDPKTFSGCLPAADDGKWVFPVGTVMVKNFMFPDTSRPSGYKVVETRLLVHLDKAQKVQGVMSEWIGYSYKWDDAQTDATLIGTLGVDGDGSDIGVSSTFDTKPTAGGATQQIKWEYPSRIDCITCHTAVAPDGAMPNGGYAIGPETIQMNRVPAGETTNQIDKIAALGLFDTAPAKPYKTALVAPYAGQAGSPPANATLEQRARSYLHANCSFCHRPDGKWNGFDVRFDVPFKSTGLCNGMPGKGDLGVTGATLLTPKMPMSSLVWLRMHAPQGNEQTGATGRMPAIGSAVVDTQGTDLISQWITSINSCPQ
jgi:hypothetical protein